MPIFQDNNGMAVKFFLQKDLTQEIQAELCETITSLGGRVEAKVPRQGYILVQPGTAEEERLRLCWTSMDRPDRFFVPYTYVEACKIAGMLLKQIFVEENGSPIGMHIHPSIANVNARSALSSRIMHSGGDPHASAQSARVILADPNTDVFYHLVKVYQGVANKYIESYLWVKKCIERSAVVYTPLVYKNPGGRRPGEERTQFNEEDEERLCNWIATKIPYKETGGRTGNRLYQQLCDLSGDPEYAWVTRHTWQSWRERYKKNAKRLDALIARIVDQKKPAQGEKGQYGYVRQAEEKPKRIRKKRMKQVEQYNEDNYMGAVQGLTGMPMSGPRALSHLPLQNHEQLAGMQDLQDAGSTYPVLFSQPSIVSLEQSAIRRSPAEEEMEDSEDSQGWMVKVGDAPPPVWGKRRASGALEDAIIPSKRLKPIEPHFEDNQMREFSTSALVALANIHVIDQNVRDIAKEFRFTVEEVQECYNKHPDMNRTRNRFRSMRQELQERFPDDDS